ncbi:ABC transporter permease [Granulicoccus phenolivorans]|uniref:ABC transporter permease n=1 Tax=Granulicoccus phenolivorans TaxID=266854 RepID=UPI00040C8F66|nr:ABC transporter permease [Granulicoccus phenolivorans]
MHLFRPELIRLTTRRISWISAAVAGLLLIAINAGTWSTVQHAARTMGRYAGERRYAGVFAFAENAGSMAAVAGLLGATVAYIAAAAYQGSESSSGALGTWLSFVPERARVYAAKLGAVTLAAAAYGTLLVGGSLGSMLILTLSVGGNPAPGRAPLYAVNAVLYIVAGALLGSALGTLLRSTLGALGAAIGLLVLSVVLSILPGMLGLRTPALLTYSLAFLGIGDVVGARSAAAGVVTLLPVAVLVAVAAVVFCRRDVD